MKLNLNIGPVLREFHSSSTQPLYQTLYIELYVENQNLINLLRTQSINQSVIRRHNDYMINGNGYLYLDYIDAKGGLGLGAVPGRPLETRLRVDVKVRLILVAGNLTLPNYCTYITPGPVPKAIFFSRIHRTLFQLHQ